jgi:hypothetical protein
MLAGVSQTASASVPQREDRFLVVVLDLVAAKEWTIWSVCPATPLPRRNVSENVRKRLAIGGITD